VENVALPLMYAGADRAEMHSRAHALLGRVGLHGKEKKIPLELSGGERQRVAIARALANSPKLILADEPTGNLDSASSKEIMQMLVDLNAEGITVIMVTHEADITAHARRIVFSGYFTAGGLELALKSGKLRIVKEGKTRKFTRAVEHVTFSGRRARINQQDITFVTERCVIKLGPTGLTVTEIAPGVDLACDVLAQADIELRVSPNLKTMDARLFKPEPMGLVLE